jgi:ABC-type oligopeptide transport system substrate-binding subunit
MGFAFWGADFLTPSGFFDQFRCRGSVIAGVNLSQFCDHAVDAGHDAALAAHGTEANARWAALDRRVAAASPAIPLFNRRALLLASDRVGNAQTHMMLGPLLDQFWVQ